MPRFVRPWDRLVRSDRWWLGVFTIASLILAGLSWRNVPPLWHRAHVIHEPTRLIERSIASMINLHLFSTGVALALMVQPAIRLVRAGLRSHTPLETAFRQLPDDWVVFAGRPWQEETSSMVEDVVSLARISMREDPEDPSSDRFVVGPGRYALITCVDRVPNEGGVTDATERARRLAESARASLSPRVLGPLEAPLPVLWVRSCGEAHIRLESSGWRRCGAGELAPVLKSGPVRLSERQRATIVSLLARNCGLAGERMVKDVDGSD